jgi:hypothetical protein
MDEKEFRIEEYKLLREEILENQREANRTELSCALALGAFYGWLLLHKSSITSPAVWYIGPFIVIVSMIRNAILTYRINQTGGYLKLGEDVLLDNKSKAPGWEHYLAINCRRGGKRADCYWLDALLHWAHWCVFRLLVFV